MVVLRTYFVTPELFYHYRVDRSTFRVRKIINNITNRHSVVMAYEFAEYSRCKFPESWNEKKICWERLGNRISLNELGTESQRTRKYMHSKKFGFKKTAMTDFYPNYEPVMLCYNFTLDLCSKDLTDRSTEWRDVLIVLILMKSELTQAKFLAEKKQRQVLQIV